MPEYYKHNAMTSSTHSTIPEPSVLGNKLLDLQWFHHPVYLFYSSVVQYIKYKYCITSCQITYETLSEHISPSPTSLNLVGMFLVSDLFVLDLNQFVNFACFLGFLC